MDLKERIAEIADILDVDEECLSMDTMLDSLDEWDSITRLSLMIYFEEEVGKKVTGEQIKELKTVKDILDLID